MDLGVGSFVFSQGVVSAIPILKDPVYLSSSPAPKILRTIKKTLPLIFLGIVRVIMVKGVEYPVRPHCIHVVIPIDLTFGNIGT